MTDNYESFVKSIIIDDALCESVISGYHAYLEAGQMNARQQQIYNAAMAKHRQKQANQQRVNNIAKTAIGQKVAKNYQFDNWQNAAGQNAQPANSAQPSQPNKAAQAAQKPSAKMGGSANGNVAGANAQSSQFSGGWAAAQAMYGKPQQNAQPQTASNSSEKAVAAGNGSNNASGSDNYKVADWRNAAKPQQKAAQNNRPSGKVQQIVQGATATRNRMAQTGNRGAAQVRATGAPTGPHDDRCAPETQKPKAVAANTKPAQKTPAQVVNAKPAQDAPKANTAAMTAADKSVNSNPAGNIEASNKSVAAAAREYFQEYNEAWRKQYGEEPPAAQKQKNYQKAVRQAAQDYQVAQQANGTGGKNIDRGYRIARDENGHLVRGANAGKSSVMQKHRAAMQGAFDQADKLVSGQQRLPRDANGRLVRNGNGGNSVMQKHRAAMQGTFDQADKFLNAQKQKDSQNNA